MEHQDGRRFIVLGHQYGRRDVTSVLYDDYKRRAAKNAAVHAACHTGAGGKRLVSTNKIFVQCLLNFSLQFLSIVLKLTKPVHTDHLFSRQSPSSAGNITTGDLLTASARGYFIFLSRAPRSFSRFARELADVFG